MEDYKKVIEDFKIKAWESKPFERMLKIRKESPDELFPFLKLCLKEIPKGGTFVDAALSYISETEFKELIVYSINLSKKSGWTDVTCAVIDYAALQFPFLLLDHLAELIDTRSNSYYEKWVWRKATPKEMNLLISILESDDEKRKNDAWESLIRIRNDSAILRAKELFNEGCPRPELGFDIYSMESGFEVRNGAVRQLYQDDSYHIVFANEYLEELDKSIASSVNYAALSKKNHPTWTLQENEGLSYKLGGRSLSFCGSCGEKLHHLIVLPEKLMGNGHDVSLATCLSCIGWEEERLFYKHDSAGIPTSLNIKKEQCVPQFKTVPLQQTEIKLVKTPERWEFQDWGLSNSRENLNRVFGSPTWIQGADYPSCPSCNNTMTFCAQFDSELLLEDGEEWLWGSGGICYAFWCSSCNISGLFWQCT